MRTRTVRALWACLLACVAFLVTPATPTMAAPGDPVGGPLLVGTELVVDAPADVPAPPEVSDGAWLIADADTGEVLAARSPHTAFLPASTLKVLTALVLLPRVAPARAIDAAPEDVAADGTRVGLVAGLPYTADQLYQAMLMSSANDATYALCRLNGGRDQTVTDMNALAAHLGALDTVVGDPSGLDAPGQTTSVYDLALMGRAALRSPDLMAYAQTPNAHFPGNLNTATGERETFEIANHNALLSTYPGAIGLKNGWTTAARRTFIGAATREGTTYLVTELAGEDASSAPTRQLLDWAFAYGPQLTPVGHLVTPGEIDATPAAAPTVSATPTPSPSVAVPALVAAPVTVSTSLNALELRALLLSLQDNATSALASVATSPIVALTLILVGGLAFMVGRRTAKARVSPSLTLPSASLRRRRRPARPEAPLRRAEVKAARRSARGARHASGTHRARRTRGRHGAR